MSDFTDEKVLPQNPFSEEYWEGEIKALGLRKSPYVVDHVRVTWFQIQGRCDDYLNKNMRFSDVWMPRLAINGSTWMSLTPMEIQSAALALHRAHGKVVTGGLGLGYFALRAAAKPEVTAVIVYEIDPGVIEWFNRVYKNRPERSKISIVEGDARKLFKGVECDFVYMDIYQTMLGDEVISDTRQFRRHNRIGRYHYWGYERVILELLAAKMLKYGSLMLGSDLRSYFRHWTHTPFSDSGEMLPDFSRLELDEEFLKKVKRTVVDFPI